MNWVDAAVIAIIGLFGIIGLINGFILTVFRLVSFFASVVISLKFYPKVAEFLMKTNIYTGIRDSIYNSLMSQQPALVPKVDGQAKQAAAEAVVGRMKLPEFLKDALLDKIPNPSSLVDVSKLMELISDELAKAVTGILSLILLYVLVRIGLIFLKFILKGIANLPVLKQIDKLGGFAFGAVEGLLTVYIIFTVLMLFSAAPWFKAFSDSVSASKIAIFFYQNNFIGNWMFP